MGKPAFPTRQRKTVAAIRVAEPAPPPTASLLPGEDVDLRLNRKVNRGKSDWPLRERSVVDAAPAPGPADAHMRCAACGKGYASGEVPDEWQCECGGVIELAIVARLKANGAPTTVQMCVGCFRSYAGGKELGCVDCGGLLVETANATELATILQRTDVRQASRAIWLAERGVTDPCPSCAGEGRKAYGNTSTWRKGFGGQAITWDVCDVCWGTGDRFRKGCDLRAWRDQEARETARYAVELLAKAAGAPYEHSQAAVTAIVALLLREAVTAGRRRVVGVKAPPWMAQHLTTLADTLENGIRRGE